MTILFMRSEEKNSAVYVSACASFPNLRSISSSLLSLSIPSSSPLFINSSISSIFFSVSASNAPFNAICGEKRKKAKDKTDPNTRMPKTSGTDLEAQVLSDCLKIVIGLNTDRIYYGEILHGKQKVKSEK